MMADFQPIGYRFQVVSLLDEAMTKTKIRQKKVGWFTAKNGARGWIVGPYMCLWWSGIDRHGPMILARIKLEGAGCIISGRAGADLNGTLAFVALTPLMAWLTYMMARASQGSITSYVTIAIVFGLGLPLTLWINSKDRREADPLVNFIRRTVKSSPAGNEL